MGLGPYRLVSMVADPVCIMDVLSIHTWTDSAPPMEKVSIIACVYFYFGVFGENDMEML